MLDIRDEVIATFIIEKEMKEAIENSNTVITSSEIAQFICEWYPELVQGVSDSETNFRSLENEVAYNWHYYSFAELAPDVITEHEPYHYALAHNYGYDTPLDMYENYLVLCDAAIDGFLVIG